MKLYEIIEANATPDKTILVEEIARYKKSLITITEYHSLGSKAMLMVTDVMNAVQYAKIVPASDFMDVLETYVNSIPDLTEEEREEQKELINFNSMNLCDL